jgi:Velvet factor
VIEILLDDNDPYKYATGQVVSPQADILLIVPRNFLSSPYYFMCVTLHDTCKAETSNYSRNTDLAGTLVSSLHRVKDTENNGGCWRAKARFHVNSLTDVGYFVFQDLSIRKEGDFRLKFSLFELQRCVPLCHFVRWSADAL